MTITTGDCVACGACASACPRGSISIRKNESGFYMPFIDSAACVECGKCRRVCPVNCRPGGENWENGTFYALWAKNAAHRREGSSGGAFGLLADAVLAAGGIVFGAAYADNWASVVQTSTDSVPLHRLKKSKYVESYTGTVFQNVKSALESGRKVLYCGTACQIDGLVLFLGKPYDNLLTCDFLCRGVPAAGVYEKYITDLEAKYGKAAGVDFRSKAFGWKAYCSKVTFESGKTYLKTLYQDPYLRIFFENTALREACYSCRRLQNSNADVTLGDFWRVKEAKNIPDTNAGISLAGVHTPKGRQALEQIAAQGSCFAEILPKECCAYAYRHVSRKPENREEKLSGILSRGSLWNRKIPAKLKIKGILYHMRAMLQKCGQELNGNSPLSTEKRFDRKVL